MSDTASTPIANSFQLKLAHWISIIGHPFLLMPVLTGIIAYTVLPPDQALIAELVALGIVIVPAGLYTVIRVRRGTWGDLDVSNPQERNHFYEILLPLLIILTIIALFVDVPRSIPLGTFAISMLVATAYVLNKWIKVSLHTGFGVFVAFALFLVIPGLGIIASLLAMMIAWSRVVLKRHSRQEVMLGGTLGLVIGGLFVAAVRLFLTTH